MTVRSETPLLLHHFSSVRKRLLSFVAFSATAALVNTASFAAAIAVPDFSFENIPIPGNVPAYPYNNGSTPGTSWQTTQSQFQIGIFPNPDGSNGDRIDNLNGNQAAFIFAGPGITLFQTLTEPEASYEVGKSYTFTVGYGGNSGLPDQARLQLRLYFLDGTTKTTVATSSILFNPDPDGDGTENEKITHLYDLSVSSFEVTANSPWVNKKIGLEISTPIDAPGAPTDGGYWDVDNIRLISVPEPTSALILSLVGFGASLLRPRKHRLD